MNQIQLKEMKERIEKVKVELEYSTSKFENPRQANLWAENLRQVLEMIHNEEEYPLNY